MVRVNDQGYLERRTSRKCYSPYFLIKYSAYSGYISLGNNIISFPRSYVGKRVRIKVEVVE